MSAQSNPSLKCPQGHVVRKYKTKLHAWQGLVHGKSCDLCGVDIPRNVPRWRCGEHCDFDVCDRCWDRHWSSLVKAAMKLDAARARKVLDMVPPIWRTRQEFQQAAAALHDAMPPPPPPRKTAPEPHTTTEQPAALDERYGNARAATRSHDISSVGSAPVVAKLEPETLKQLDKLSPPEKMKPPVAAPPLEPPMEKTAPKGVKVHGVMKMALWIATWLIVTPPLMRGCSVLLTQEDLQFQYPFLVMGFSHAGAALIMFVLFKIPALNPGQGMTIPDMPDEKPDENIHYRNTHLKFGLLGVLQGLEIALGGVVQTGTTLGLRTDLQMVTPVVVFAAALFAGTERRPRHRRMWVCLACAVVGGLLSVRGDVRLIHPSTVLMAMVVRCISAAKWVSAQVWLNSIDPRRPPPGLLAQRMLVYACMVGFELNLFLGYGYSGLFSLPQPKKVFVTLLGLAVGVALRVMAEMHIVRLTSATLMGFLQPFSAVLCLVLEAIFYDQVGSLINWIGAAMCLAAGAGYFLMRNSELRPEVKDNYVNLEDAGKEIIARGDEVHFPRRFDQVVIRYRGWMTDEGEESTFDTGLVNFTVGQGQVIRGWDLGVMRMSLGERSIFQIPSNLGYGAQGCRPIIPPHADLTFEMQLVAINDQKAVLDVLMRM